MSLATVYHERARGDTGQMDANGRGGYSAELAVAKYNCNILNTSILKLLYLSLNKTFTLYFKKTLWLFE